MACGTRNRRILATSAVFALSIGLTKNASAQDASEALEILIDFEDNDRNSFNRFELETLITSGLTIDFSCSPDFSGQCTVFDYGGRSGRGNAFFLNPIQGDEIPEVGLGADPTGFFGLSSTGEFGSNGTVSYFFGFSEPIDFLSLDFIDLGAEQRNGGGGSALLTAFSDPNFINQIAVGEFTYESVLPEGNVRTVSVSGQGFLSASLTFDFVDPIARDSGVSIDNLFIRYTRPTLDDQPVEDDMTNENGMDAPPDGDEATLFLDTGALSFDALKTLQLRSERDSMLANVVHRSCRKGAWSGGVSSVETLVGNNSAGSSRLERFHIGYCLQTSERAKVKTYFEIDDGHLSFDLVTDKASQSAIRVGAALYRDAGAIQFVAASTVSTISTSSLFTRQAETFSAVTPNLAGWSYTGAVIASSEFAAGAVSFNPIIGASGSVLRLGNALGRSDDGGADFSVSGLNSFSTDYLAGLRLRTTLVSPLAEFQIGLSTFWEGSIYLPENSIVSRVESGPFTGLTQILHPNSYSGSRLQTDISVSAEISRKIFIEGFARFASLNDNGDSSEFGGRLYLRF